MISETAYSSQTKLIEQSLPIGGHGIGYLNLAFVANKGAIEFCSKIEGGQNDIVGIWTEF